MMCLQWIQREKANDKANEIKMNLGGFSFHGTILIFQIFINLELFTDKKSFLK